MLRHDFVHLVGKLTMKDAVLKTAEAYGDEWARKIIKRHRINYLIDLIQ